MDDALGGFTGVGVVPTGPFVAWTANGYSCELHTDKLAVTDPDDDSGLYKLVLVAEVRLDPDRNDLLVSWCSKADLARSRVGRLGWQLASWVTADPPERLRCRDTATRKSILEALTDLAVDLDLDVEIETPD